MARARGRHEPPAAHRRRGRCAARRARGARGPACGKGLRAGGERGQRTAGPAARGPGGEMSPPRHRGVPRIFRGAAAVVLITVLPSAARALDVPALTGRVVDGAGVLGTEARQRIEAQLQAHEARTTDQVAVLTVPSLGGETVEGYAE